MILPHISFQAIFCSPGDRPPCMGWGKSSLSVCPFPPDAGICSSFRKKNFNYESFDGAKHEIRGNCSYILAMSCHFTTETPFFKISVQNMQWEKGPELTSVVRQIHVYAFGSWITLQKDNLVLVSIDCRKKTGPGLPLPLSSSSSSSTSSSSPPSSSSLLLLLFSPPFLLVLLRSMAHR